MKCLPNSLSCSPDLQITDLLHLLLVLVTVIGLRVERKRTLSLLSSLNRVIQLIKDRLQCILEASAPVDGTTTSSRRAGLVHPVHAVCSNQWVQTLGSLLHSLVEGLAGAVTLLTKNLVLCEEHTVDTSHQATTLTVQVGVDFLLECGLVQVSTSNTHTEGNCLLLGLASYILVDSDGGVDTTAFAEESSHSSARSLGGNKDDINILGNINLCLVLENWRETVGEVEGLLQLA
jgi:hypothetical protein